MRISNKRGNPKESKSLDHDYWNNHDDLDIPHFKKCQYHHYEPNTYDIYICIYIYPILSHYYIYKTIDGDKWTITSITIAMVTNNLHPGPWFLRFSRHVLVSKDLRGDGLGGVLVEAAVGHGFVELVLHGVLRKPWEPTWNPGGSGDVSILKAITQQK